MITPIVKKWSPIHPENGLQILGISPPAMRIKMFFLPLYMIIYNLPPPNLRIAVTARGHLTVNTSWIFNIFDLLCVFMDFFLLSCFHLCSNLTPPVSYYLPKISRLPRNREGHPWHFRKSLLQKQYNGAVLIENVCLKSISMGS